MAQKKYLSVYESSFFLEINSLPERKISDVLKKEASAFKERNSIVIGGYDVKTKQPIHRCCPRCLKAHLIKKAEELDLDHDLRELLFSMVEFETGHYGYYMDGDELIKI